MSQKIKIAASRQTPKDLSFNHYTTLNFGHCIPVASYEVAPKTHMTIRPSVFARVAPMVLPNLGSIQLNMHAFYVPFRQVWMPFDCFFTGRKYWLSGSPQIYKRCPYTNNIFLSMIFARNNSYGANISGSDVMPIAASNYDFVYLNTTNRDLNHAVKLNKRGKYIYQILSSLGYKFSFRPQNAVGVELQEFSLLPLMAYFKAFLDMYIPSQLQQSSRINQFLKSVNESTSATINQPIDDTRIVMCFDEVYTYYQRNYFTSAWQKPNAPVEGFTSYDDVTINTISSQDTEPETYRTDESGKYSVTSNDYSVNPSEEQNSGGNGYANLSADGLSLIQKFNNFIKRLNYSGSRAVEALKSIFGVTPPSLELGITEYLGSYSTSLQKSDVTITGNKEDAGEYVGKSWFSSSNERTFKVNCDYHGIVLVMASLQTPSTFVRGVRRNLLHLKPNDFYNPDFDGTILQAISSSEIHSQFNYTNNFHADEMEFANMLPDNVFGFVPRYCEYSQILDNVSGDFDLEKYGLSIDGFLLNREVINREKYRMNYINQDSQTADRLFYNSTYANNFSADVLSVLKNSDAIQFNRIFVDTDGLSDPFFCVFHFDTLSNSVPIPIDETAEIKGRGKEMMFDKNGMYIS